MITTIAPLPFHDLTPWTMHLLPKWSNDYFSSLTRRWLHFHTPLVLMICDLFSYGSSPPYLVQPFHQRVTPLTQLFSSKIPTPLHYPTIFLKPHLVRIHLHSILWTHLGCSSSVSAYNFGTLPLPVSIFHFQPLFFHKPCNIDVLPLLNPHTQLNSSWISNKGKDGTVTEGRAGRA